MATASKYRNHFKKREFGKIFIKHKEFTLEADMDFTKECMSIISKKLNQNPIDVLEIGPGDGKISICFIQTISTRKKIHNYLGLEISPGFLKVLKSKQKALEKYSDIVRFKLKDATKFSTKQKYDLIVAFNSWYGIDFNKIPYFLSILKNNGIMSILLNSEKNITIDLTRKFAENIISSEDFCDWLDRKKIKYKSHRLISKVLSRKDFIRKNKLNPKAEFFYRYMIRKSTGSIEDIYELLSKKSDYSFRLPQDLIVIINGNLELIK